MAANKGLRPGQKAPKSGQYQKIGPRGGKGDEVTSVTALTVVTRTKTAGGRRRRRTISQPWRGKRLQVRCWTISRAAARLIVGPVVGQVHIAVEQTLKVASHVAGVNAERKRRKEENAETPKSEEVLFQRFGVSAFRRFTPAVCLPFLGCPVSSIMPMASASACSRAIVCCNSQLGSSLSGTVVLGSLR